MASSEDAVKTGRGAGRSFFSPLFVAGGLVLLAAALGLRPALAALRETYRKESVAVKRPLDQFDVSQLPSFETSSGGLSPLFYTKDVGTEEYVWLNLAEHGLSGADAYVSLFVTYYSSPGDKVAHTPEVCYRQGGTVIEGGATVVLETPGLAPESPSVAARQVFLVQPQGRGALVYVFCADGEFCCDRDRVRWITTLPGSRYVYYSKVEAVAFCSPGADDAAVVERCKRLLSEALPVLVNDHFPDRSLFTRR